MANEPREYRKGNWTVEETMVLIKAKKMDDERRLMIRYGGESSSSGKPGELRWKRVEDYCWKNGCLRSQNQCNDKWDNLMRDFKKVREYQRRVAGGGDDGGEKSYWTMDKNERKEHSLPSNMLPQIFDALVEVVERKGPVVMVGGEGGGGVIVPAAAAHTMLLPLQPPAQPPTRPFAEPSFPTVDSETSGHSESPAKRRKRSSSRERGGDGDACAGAGVVGGSSLQEVCSAISQSGSIIAEAIQSREEREERRHIAVLNLHERRLQIEESNAEVNRQGINGLVDAINKLANSILALASHKNQPDSK